MRVECQDKVKLTVSAGEGTTVQALGGNYPYGTEVRVYGGLSNSSKYNWDGWYNGNTKLTSNYEAAVKLTAATTVTAKATVKTFTVTFKDWNGTVLI